MTAQEYESQPGRKNVMDSPEFVPQMRALHREQLERQPKHIEGSLWFRLKLAGIIK